MLPAGAAASKKSFELHFSAATVNSIKCCWMGSMGLPLGFLLNKRHHAVAKAIWLTCGMYMCVPKTAGDSFAMVKASARSERQMLEKGIDTHTHTHTHLAALPSMYRPDDTGQLRSGKECKHHPTHSGTIYKNKPDIWFMLLRSAYHAQFPGIPASKSFLALAHFSILFQGLTQ